MKPVLISRPNLMSFLEALHSLKDKRDNRGKYHHLVFLIVAVTLSILS